MITTIHRIKRAAAVLLPALALVLASGAASPAFAHDRDCWPPGHCKQGKGKKQKQKDRVVVIERERPVIVEAPPQVIYAPPPVVYAPPPPPGINLGVTVPLRR